MIWFAAAADAKANKAHDAIKAQQQQGSLSDGKTVVKRVGDTVR